MAGSGRAVTRTGGVGVVLFVGALQLRASRLGHDLGRRLLLCAGWRPGNKVRGRGPVRTSWL
jgi:hypothetical protein